MALLMLFATTLINHLLVSEAEEVESMLAETRVYWAMNGHLNYMLSRAAAQGLCANGAKAGTLALNQAAECKSNPTTDTDGTGSHPSFSSRSTGSIVGALQDYLDGADELRQSGTIDNPGSLTWYFPQNANATNDGTTALNGNNLTNTANQYQFSIRGVVDERMLSTNVAAADGQVRLDLDITEVGNVPVLRNIADRVGRLTVGFCVVDQYDDGGTLKASPSTANCATGQAEGTSRIQFIQRNFPFSY
ncbi:hypothetical protein [Azospirillum sp. B2RO_4]|uniref:hypothetical protein n=1 Tax=Azospirillum sp. B2RO_4 TaxID=3027796 RepID=UPI003DA8CCAC